MSLKQLFMPESKDLLKKITEAHSKVAGTRQKQLLAKCGTNLRTHIIKYNGEF